MIFAPPTIAQFTIETGTLAFDDPGEGASLSVTLPSAPQPGNVLVAMIAKPENIGPPISTSSGSGWGSLGNTGWAQTLRVTDANPTLTPFFLNMPISEATTLAWIVAVWELSAASVVGIVVPSDTYIPVVLSASQKSGNPLVDQFPSYDPIAPYLPEGFSDSILALSLISTQTPGTTSATSSAYTVDGQIVTIGGELFGGNPPSIPAVSGAIFAIAAHRHFSNAYVTNPSGPGIGTTTTFNPMEPANGTTDSKLLCFAAANATPTIGSGQFAGGAIGNGFPVVGAIGREANAAGAIGTGAYGGG